MKPYSIIILFIAFISVSCSSKTIVLSEEELPVDVFYLSDEIKPFSGTCIIYFKNTTDVKEELNFKNGVLHGERISYYKGGQIRLVGAYEIGSYNGVWKSFDNKGNKLFEVEYRNDTLLGQFISWYSTGVIREKGSYSKNSRNGEWAVYNEAGMLVKKEVL
jgi:antitoxin component YwqK of YwqJK toxin-antitoxin module